MRIGTVIQARMSSQRLPHKVLHSVVGKPLLAYLLERLRQVPLLDETVVATSTDPSDTPIAEYCDRQEIGCVRGSLDDVAGRLLQAAQTHRLDAFVRISGDSPLLDPQLVRDAVHAYREGEWDLVTNVFPRTFPRGESVEVIRRETFETVDPRIREPYDREHVTPFFYKHARDFRIHNLQRTPPLDDVVLCVDTPQNLDVFTRIVAAMDRPHWEYGLADVVELYRAVTRGMNFEVQP